MNTSEPFVIEASPWSMALICAGAIVMALLSGAVALHLLPGPPPSDMAQMVSWFSLPFFAACAALAVWRMTRLSGPVVTIAPEGFRDVRVAREFVPWTGITHVSTWQVRRQRVMILAVKPEVESGLTLTPIARWTRAVNRSPKADGLAITPAGLKIGYDRLLAVTTAYLNAWRV